MKKATLIISFLLIGMVLNSQTPGDSLAVLYKHVYLYKDPAQLGSRVDSKGVSYLNKEKLFLFEINSQFPSYFRVITSSSDTAYVKSELVSFDQSLTHSTIYEEVRSGMRKQDINHRINANDYLPTWAIFLIMALIFYIIFLYIKHYRRFDSWFVRISGSTSKPVKYPWFILVPLIFGFILGSVSLFSPKEAQWYFMDGWQFYGSYPNYWGWMMWSCTMASVLILFLSSAISFFRFSILFAIIYTVIITLSSVIVFLFGAFTGGFAVIIFIAYLILEFGSTGRGSSNIGDHARIDGILHKKTGPNTWERV